MKVLTLSSLLLICFLPWLLKLLHINPDKKQTMTEAELRTIVNVSHELVLLRMKNKYDYNVFDLTDSEAKRNYGSPV